MKELLKLSTILTVICFGAALALGHDPLFHLCAGGAMLGAFFMATDPVTTPLAPAGRIIFGCGAG